MKRDVLRKFTRIFPILVTILLTILLCGCGSADKGLELNTDFTEPRSLSDGGGRRMRVILLLGQSNATGVALNSCLANGVGDEKYEVYESGFSNVLINYSVDNVTNSSNGEFIKTTVGCGHTEAYFGPELGMAEALSERYPDELFVILKYTYSGSCLATQWLDGHERGEIYNACLKFVGTYMDALSSHGYDARIDAICWMQGESDAIGTIAKRYYDNQSRFASFLRSDLERYESDSGICFIDAGINNISLWPKHDVINSAKERFAEQSPLNMYFSTVNEGLTTLNEPIGEPDVAHYDAMSELKLGHLFGGHIIKFYEEIN